MDRNDNHGRGDTVTIATLWRFRNFHITSVESKRPKLYNTSRMCRTAQIIVNLFIIQYPDMINLWTPDGWFEHRLIALSRSKKL